MDFFGCLRMILDFFLTFSNYIKISTIISTQQNLDFADDSHANKEARARREDDKITATTSLCDLAHAATHFYCSSFA